MKYWLLKSEPDVWSIDQQKKVGEDGSIWDGVRNYQAANNLKQMKIGDLCFFYHSNIGKEIVGIVEVIKESFIDPTDKMKKFVAIKVKYKKHLKKKPEIIVLNKSDLLENEDIKKVKKSLMKITKNKVHIISTITNEGIDELKQVILRMGLQDED